MLVLCIDTEHIVLIKGCPSSLEGLSTQGRSEAMDLLEIITSWLERHLLYLVVVHVELISALVTLISVLILSYRGFPSVVFDKPLV